MNTYSAALMLDGTCDCGRPCCYVGTGVNTLTFSKQSGPLLCDFDLGDELPRDSQWLAVNQLGG